MGVEARARAANRGVGQFRTQTPDYDPITKVFTQCIEFRAFETIPSEQAGYVVEKASEQFRHSLALNGLLDFKWPPDRVECHGHADAKGMLITFGTRADRRKQVVLQ